MAHSVRLSLTGPHLQTGTCGGLLPAVRIGRVFSKCILLALEVVTDGTGSMGVCLGVFWAYVHIGACLWTMLGHVAGQFHETSTLSVLGYPKKTSDW